jgi:D-alanyl-D-alanine-carboxypeptidase/D-alanyl-D-alanine-endopeptidase
MLAVIAPLLAGASLQSALDARVAGAPGTAIVAGVIDRGVQRIYVAGSAGNGRSIDEHTLFEIGSVTKTFTATALAIMALRGQVRLSDPIAKYLPKGVHAPSEKGKPITLLDLAEQRSGLPRLPDNMTNVADDDPYADYTNADMYAFLNGYKLTREPGAAYEYSNFGIGLLGQLLANRAGTTYPALVRENVLKPLGMNETAFLTTGTRDPAQLAVGHDLNGDPVATWHAQAIAPAGTIASNVVDMLQFLRCNMGQGSLKRACLFAQLPRADGEARHRIGLVWNVNSSNGIVSHGGDTNGFHAFIAISRDRQTGAVVLSNGPAVADIASHLLVPSFPVAACPASVAADKIDPAAYAGVYCNSSTGLRFTVDATSKADELSIALLPQRAASVKRSSADTFSQPIVGATFKFEREDGKIVGLWLLQNGQEIPAVRLDSQGKAFVSQLPSPFPNVVTLDPALLQQYVGSYKAEEIGTVTVMVRSGSSLYVQLTGQPAARVYASGKDQFFYKIVDAQISFDRDPSGTVTSLTLHQNDQVITAMRTSP